MFQQIGKDEQIAVAIEDIRDYWNLTTLLHRGKNQVRRVSQLASSARTITILAKQAQLLPISSASYNLGDQRRVFSDIFQVKLAGGTKVPGRFTYWKIYLAYPGIGSQVPYTSCFI